MKKILSLCATIVAVASFSVACSGGGGGGGIGLTSGCYNVVTAEVSPDPCGFSTSFYDVGNVDVDIDAANTTLDVDVDGVGLTYDITNEVDLYDQSTPPPTAIACNTTNSAGFFRCSVQGTGNRSYNCTVTRTFDFSGTITGKNKFTLADTYGFTATGSDCSVVSTSSGIPYPCESIDHADFSK